MRLNFQDPVWERSLCAWANRLNRRMLPSRLFGAVSRLGDGLFWYCLMIVLPLVYGWSDGWLSLRMAITGFACTVVYKGLKAATRRLRPCELHQDLHRTVAPLDRFSFPSGHTLHAVAFTWMACAAHPELMWILIPFTILVGASRLVLGLHYPSDVAAGAVIGGGLAALSNALAALPSSPAG